MVTSWSGILRPVVNKSILLLRIRILSTQVAFILARLADAYARFFYSYVEAPLMIVNSERLNFVDNPDHLALLLSRIASMRSQREFFNLGQHA